MRIWERKKDRDGWAGNFPRDFCRPIESLSRIKYIMFTHYSVSYTRIY